MDSGDKSLIDWRVKKLEDSHDTMSKTLQELVIEFKSTKRLLALIVILVGLAQPFVISFVNQRGH